MKTYTLHLLRHGLTKGNLEGLYIGHTDTPLCAEGKEQLLQMKKELCYPECSFVFSSPLKICIELIFGAPLTVPAGKDARRT